MRCGHCNRVLHGADHDHDCLAAQIFRLAEGLRHRFPWPDGFQPIGMARAYQKMTASQRAELEDTFRAPFSELQAGVDLYEEQAIGLVYLGLAWLALAPIASGNPTPDRLIGALHALGGEARPEAPPSGIMASEAASLAFQITEIGWDAWLERIR